MNNNDDDNTFKGEGLWTHFERHHDTSRRPPSKRALAQSRGDMASKPRGIQHRTSDAKQLRQQANMKDKQLGKLEKEHQSAHSDGARERRTATAHGL